jgi:N-acetylated-alpha-linked acidic dipeptidase
VVGDVVYANFGTEEDFKQLNKMGVFLKDCIVIIRQGRIFRGNKVCSEVYTFQLCIKVFCYAQ